MTDRPGVVVAGAGAAGLGVARALRAAGWTVGALACRTQARARERVAALGQGEPLALAELAAGVPGDAPVLLLVAVPDRAVADVAGLLAAGRWPAGSVALHLSGSVEVEALAALRGAGVAVGGAHPLRSFVDEDRSPRPLQGIVLALEGDPPAVALAERLAADTGALPFRLAAGTRAAWHAAAAHAANHLVALLDQALDLMQVAGLPRETARTALLPLLAGILDNLRRLPPERALTGPVARGDADVVAAHLRALSAVAPDVGSAYRALAGRALALARRRGLADPLADAVARALAEGGAP